MAYSVQAAAARSPARPWSQFPSAAAWVGPAPWARSAAMSPVSTSPLPPLAMPQLPVAFSSTVPQGVAVRLRCPFKMSQHPWATAKFLAAWTLPPERSPIRANSPSWGVSTVTRPRLPSRISICPARALMPSASSTTVFSVSASSRRTSSAVPSRRPRPGPRASTSQRESFSRMPSRAPRASPPSFAARGKGMAEVHFTASTGQMSSGTPRWTRPQPPRTAPSAVSQAAPV